MTLLSVSVICTLIYTAPSPAFPVSIRSSTLALVDCKSLRKTRLKKPSTVTIKSLNIKRERLELLLTMHEWIMSSIEVLIPTPSSKASFIPSWDLWGTSFSTEYHPSYQGKVEMCNWFKPDVATQIPQDSTAPGYAQTQVTCLNRQKICGIA